jgi:sugar lactone lactonase YvrE
MLSNFSLSILVKRIMPFIFASITVAIFVEIPSCFAQDTTYGPMPSPNILTAQISWTGPTSQFVTATTEDATGWWWGTDNDGLWHYTPMAKAGLRWQHVRAEDGLYDDSITSLCVDRVGRLWVGTERRGVSVYNNSWWQNYDVITGPLGVHVSSIVMNPINGDIWISSEGGIAIYSDRTKSWRYITASTGIGTNDINCIAFSLSGDVIVGTADDGLLLSSPKSNYYAWTHIVASPSGMASESGSGLTSNQINCLVINKAGKIFCGTSSGLCFSTDHGKSWTFLHGYKWQLRISREERNILQVDESSPLLPLSDDYISALAYAKNGYLYIGHRNGGVEVLDDTDGSQLYHTKLDEYGIDIRSLTLLSTGGLIVGNYGDGVSEITWTTVKALPEFYPVSKHAIVQFPVPAPPLTTAQLSQMTTSLRHIPSGSGSPAGYFLGEDWLTQGSWIGRYGREFAVLCAADGNQDYVLGDQTQFTVTPQIGIALNGSTVPSHWLQWETSGDPRVLYDPEVRTRRESEWDDQGEQDEALLQGPDIWLTVQIPAGIHRLALYFMNKDGHTRTTRFRDFIVQIIPALPNIDYHQTYDTVSIMPATAETRVENLWPGVYENFVVTGPGTYYVKIDKNGSLNTIVQGVFIDRLDKPGFFIQPTWMNGFDIPNPVAKNTALTAPVSKDVGAWSQLDSLYNNAASSPYQRTDRILLLRAIIAEKAPDSLIDRWRKELGLWSDRDWASFNQSVNRMNKLSAASPKS